MKNKLNVPILLLLLINTIVLIPVFSQQRSPVITIEQLKKIRLPEVRIDSAMETSDSKSGMTYCRVLGTIGSEIHFELLLPDQWNSRFVMGGGGGFVGSVQNMARFTVNEGYATAGTDTGHKSDGIHAGWALNNMEREVNFGFLAVHRTTEVSKVIILNYYGIEPLFSYFFGCSRGGGQALMEAQRYPDDFNGIVAGAPAIYWPATAAKFIQDIQKDYPDPKDLSSPVITNANLAMLESAILKQCDALDGVKDSILNDPRDCNFKLSELPRCATSQPADNCFTEKELEAVKAIYDEVSNAQGEIYPGFPFGSENEPNGWKSWIVGSGQMAKSFGFPSAQFGFGTEMFKFLVFNNPNWDYSTYHTDNFFEETAYASSFLDAGSTDYSKFKEHKGKLILYHGWEDPALSPLSSIEYYEATEKKDPGIRDYFRLFLLPGVLHCGGGPGPDQVDWIKYIGDWVESGKAPDEIVSLKMEDGKVKMTRPVFPYPRKAIYNGKGDPNEVGSFH